MPRAVIFDVDGTLIDSVDLNAQAWQDAFRDYGHEIGFEDIRGQIGKGGDQLMPVFLDREELAAMGEELEKHRSQVFQERYLSQAEAFPQVRALFERLRADGVRIALASSAKEKVLDTYKKAAAIEDLVDEQTTTDDAERSKPHPDIFQAALKRLGDMAPQDVLVVGDTLSRAVAQRRGPYSVATAELASLSEPDQQHAIDRDVDEALWEEMEAGLRHQGRITPTSSC